jgi:hypothetical protein
VGFAAAILVVDALVWEGADLSILALVADLDSIHQLLLRAAIYRIATTGAATPDDAARLDLEVRANAPLVELLGNVALQ